MKNKRLALALALCLAFSVPAYSQSVIGNSVIGKIIDFAHSTVKGVLGVANGGTGVATAPANTVFGNNTTGTAAPGFAQLVPAQESTATQFTISSVIMLSYNGL